VDDDPVLIESLSNILKGDGHEVITANGGQAGIDTFLTAQQSAAPFEAVITDLGMPYVDGRKVAGSVRAAAPHTPIILLTGWGQRLQADNDKPAQVDRLLSKPPRLHELREALAQLCEVRRD
jgi:CheY-like chemotaxis protein